MNLGLADEQQLIVDSFARLFDQHSTTADVRRAASSGFDAELWHRLAEVGALTLRVDGSCGGLGMGIFDAALVMAEAGRTLASVPLAETMIAARLISQFADGATEVVDRIAAGNMVIALALHDAVERPEQWVPGAAAAHAVLAVAGDRVLLYPFPANRPRSAPATGTCAARVDLGTSEGTPVASGRAARSTFLAGVEEWKLLTAAALNAMAAEALRLAAAYACDRTQFGQPIGAYQAVSHPLADCWVNSEAGRLLIWRAIAAVRDEPAQAGAMIALAYGWSARAAGEAVSRALHSFGGYGLTTEYDIHLYHLRARALPLLLGDPADALAEGADRLWGGSDAALPDTGAVPVDFRLGDAADALHDEVAATFRRLISPDLRNRAHYSFSGHVPEVHRAIADERLLFVNWPTELGGRDADAYGDFAAMAAWHEAGWTRHAQGTSNIIGSIINRFGSDRLKRDALARIASGEAVCSLGFSEPASGSDVFAARTQAVRDGDDWLIDGQKMFTSGADVADFVLLLARTDTSAAKHRGITMFIVPLDAPGIAVQRVETFQDEPTTITFYANVRIPDAYRLGEVDGGLAVMLAALEMEHGGATYLYAHRELLEAGVAWANRIRRSGQRPIGHDDCRRRLARVQSGVWASEVMVLRGLWSIQERLRLPAAGSASKLLSSELFLRDSLDLLDLAAMDTLDERDGEATLIAQASRHSAATTIYGGTSEIHRAVVAEQVLCLPRTR